jgi:hypothetical protein
MNGTCHTFCPIRQLIYSLLKKYDTGTSLFFGGAEIQGAKCQEADLPLIPLAHAV